MRMKLMLIAIIISATALKATVRAQHERLDVKMDGTLIELFETLEKKTNLKFVFNHDDVKNETVKFDVKKCTVKEILDQSISDKILHYEIVNENVIVYKKEIRPSVPQSESKTVQIKGNVKDKRGEALPGVGVLVKGTSIGVATDIDGNYVLEIGKVKDLKLIFSFVGMKPQEILVGNKQVIDVVLEDDAAQLEDVVVTGFFTKNKNSFTGSVKTLSVEELKTVSNTNLISAIAMMTPGLKLMESNEYGSDPNRLPEIVIRGTSSLTTEADESANQPIIILDGVEISLRDLYDIDINDIERVDVLKDASATALYGEKAANGVLIIERKRVLNDKIRVSYNLDGSIDVPDLRSYDYLNASDKLEFERLANLYNFELKDDFENYNEKKLRISKGVDTDWMAKALRTGFSVNNSLGVSGRGNGMTYRLNANVRNIKGVMKEDYRNSYGLSLFLSYHVDKKLTVSLQSTYNETKSKNSPFGSFADYVIMNPYDEPFDQYGEVIKELSWKMANPLYEAQCGNFFKQEEHAFSNSLSLRWDVVKNFYVTAKGSISTGGLKSEDYISPTSNKFKDIGNLREKGSLAVNHTKSLDYSGNVVINYAQPIGDNSMLSLHLGGDIYKDRTLQDGYKGIGFYKPELHSPGFAAGFPEGSFPNGSENISTRLGFFGNMNFILHDKYFVDGSLRRSGSSKFGANNRYAPFWSVGAGWNIHNEMFCKRDWLNTLRLRYSYGVTGNISFSPYQAITTYNYTSEYFYLHGIGTIPKSMGNKDLTWQSTRMHNIGLSVELFNNRLSGTIDYYIKTTDDMLVDLTIPPSVGQNSVKHNLGKMQNKGIEFDVTALLIRHKNWRASVKFNGAVNRNKMLAISNALDKQNDNSNKDESVSPKLLYREGFSTTAIYAVRSAGINPATGQEVFIKRNGTYTLEYDAHDKVVVGDTEPDIEGAIFPSISFKGWQLNIAMRYRFGGQLYNATRAANVENINPQNNVDRRAFDERWKNVNDIPPYLDIANADSRRFIHTSRFVEDDNTLEIKRIEIAYEFNSSWLSRAGFKRLRLGAGANDPFRLSTIKLERGTMYPFSRGFSFSISPTF
ncbi:MAG: SusC/RagA family TonB-linked outer membrane protein [Marinifilaceae bacterium]